jgi:glutathione S-transferase
LAGKQYLVGDKCTFADFAFVNWDLTLDLSMQGDKEVVTIEQRAALFPNWAAWHEGLLERPAVQRMIKAQKVAISQA